MISALIPTYNSEHRLVLTLSALVPASAEGILKEVIITDEGSSDGTEIVADASGADFVSTTSKSGFALAEGLKRCTRSNWVLLIQPGAILQAGWQAEAVSFIERAERVGTEQNLVGVFPSRTEEFGTVAQLKQKLITLTHRLLKASCHQLPMLIYKDHLQQALANASGMNRQDQLQKVLRASRVHWLNGTVIFQNTAR
ncbi:Glycosyl transferase family 2 [Pseudovibrio sp. Ad46]|uniref:glycosyltransferase family 2 protein n=1 Tax=unclassified Pseudovibrio TaxID=2627060 RepID=UPI00070FDCDB|nr:MULTISPECIES: glycosyltransferase [unclassified Pseudovibrio]KZK91469.1 Glycosyl transferase family 2 [Pseudovibrio sp. Ad46]